MDEKINLKVKAHRRIEVTLAETQSFNLLEDKKLFEFFEQNNKGTDYILLPQNIFSCLVISVSLLKKAIDQFMWKQFDYRLQALKEDVEWAEENKQDCVVYELVTI